MRERLIRWRAILAVGFLISPFVCAAAEKHRLTPTPSSVTWGYFDHRTPPALRVHSGDRVEVEALAAISSPFWEAAGLPRSQIQQALFEIERDIKDPWDIAHILAGPIYVEGAQPGDVLEVKILSVDLAFPYAINFFSPGGGFLSDEFTSSRYKLTRWTSSGKLRSSPTRWRFPCGRSSASWA